VRLQCGPDMCQALYLAEGDLKGRCWKKSSALVSTRVTDARDASVRKTLSGAVRKAP
jgi:hypothetical protein